MYITSSWQSFKEEVLRSLTVEGKLPDTVEYAAQLAYIAGIHLVLMHAINVLHGDVQVADEASEIVGHMDQEMRLLLAELKRVSENGECLSGFISDSKAGLRLVSKDGVVVSE